MSQILVTGATGTVGHQVVKALLAAGVHPRVGVRDVAKASALADKGATLVTLDFDRRETLVAAMQGVDTLFLLTPFVEDFVPLVKSAIAAAKEAGIKHIVRLSVVGANAEAQGPPRQHGICDQLLTESGLAWTLIQPTFFQDNVWNYAGATIKAQGTIYGAAGESKISYVSAADIGKVTSIVLQDPAAHAGKSYALTGPEALSEQEVAAIVSEAIGKPVTYVNLTSEQYAAGMRDNQLPEWMIEHMVALEQIKANGWAEGIAPGVQSVTGQPATSFKAYIQSHKHRLQD